MAAKPNAIRFSRPFRAVKVSLRHQRYEKAAAENTSDASLFQKNGFGDYEEVWDLENPSFPPLHDDRPAETRRVLPTIWLLWLW